MPSVVTNDDSYFTSLGYILLNVLKQSLSCLDDNNVIHTSKAASHSASQSSSAKIKPLKKQTRQFLFVRFLQEFVKFIIELFFLKTKRIRSSFAREDFRNLKYYLSTLTLLYAAQVSRASFSSLDLIDIFTSTTLCRLQTNE